MRAAGKQVHEALSREVTLRSLALLSPLPVANGRAQAMEQAGSKKPKRATHRTANASYHTGTVHRVGKRHFLRSCLCLSQEREKHRTGPGQCVNSQTPSPSRMKKTLSCGSGPSDIEAIFLSGHPWIPAHQPQVVASYKSITVPHTQKQDETGRARRIQREGWDFFECLMRMLVELEKASCFSIGRQKILYLYFMYLLFTY